MGPAAVASLEIQVADLQLSRGLAEIGQVQQVNLPVAEEETLRPVSKKSNAAGHGPPFTKQA